MQAGEVVGKKAWCHIVGVSPQTASLYLQHVKNGFDDLPADIRGKGMADVASGESETVAQHLDNHFLWVYTHWAEPLAEADDDAAELQSHGSGHQRATWLSGERQDQ